MEKYPKWLYREGESIIVDTERQHKDLDGKWYESPADVPKKTEADAERDALLKEAEALNLKIDGRTSTDKIKDAIKEAKKAK